MKLQIIVALTSLSVILVTASAEEANTYRLAVSLYQQCSDDTVGQRLAFKIREGLNQSTSMVAVDSYNDSVVRVSLVCLSPDIQDRGSVSKYSYQITLWNFKGYYDFALTHGVGTCGSQRVAECAEGIVAAIDSAVSELRVRLQEGSFKWPN